MSLDPLTREAFAAHMRAARHAAGWSLETAGRKTGIKQVVLGSWERQDRNPTLPHVLGWVEAFHLRLALLEPNEIVVGVDQSHERYLDYAVVLRGHEIPRPTRAAAEELAGQIPDARVGYRVMRRGALEFGHGGEW